jgi:hypothetical protein
MLWLNHPSSPGTFFVFYECFRARILNAPLGILAKIFVIATCVLNLELGNRWAPALICLHVFKN